MSFNLQFTVRTIAITCVKWTIAWAVEHCDTEHCYLLDDSNRLENDAVGLVHMVAFNSSSTSPG
eukprot:1186880-Prorocentrum_minimum.AAC.4